LRKVLVTGSEGLIGRGLRRALAGRGYAVERFDLRCRPDAAGDIRDREALRRRTAGCAGIVSLAAVSRVVWGERDPETCWQTNVQGLRNVLDVALAARPRPWVLFASSREVYGEPARLPACEDAPLRPMNAYGRSKAEAERLVGEAREHGLAAAVVRLSNVYGDVADHADRVVPAFARAAATGAPMLVCGRDHRFDFTHIDDVARGLVGLVEVLEDGERALPAVHLVTGRPTTLGELAALANRAGRNRCEITVGPTRSYDVMHFYGNPSRARRLLGWDARIGIAIGLPRLVEDFRADPKVEALASAVDGMDAASAVSRREGRKDAVGIIDKA
jgi:UDP-glucose 4-epimerase